jgi:hypothetical protein
MSSRKFYALSLLVILFLSSGCGGEREMHRIMLQMYAGETQQKKQEFDQFTSFIISAISNGDSKFLLENFDPKSIEKCGDKVKLVIKEAIRLQEENGFEFTKHKEPLLSMNEREDFGFEYTYKAKSENCSAELVISEIIPRDTVKEKIYIYNIGFRKIKGKCKGIESE